MDLLGAEPAERLDREARRRDIQMMAGLCTFGGILVWLRVGIRGPIDDVQLWLLMIPVAVVSTAALWRRTAPLVAVVVSIGGFALDQLVIGGSLGTALIMTSLLYDAARFGRPPFGRRLLVATIAATVLLAVVAVAQEPGFGIAVATTFALVLILPVLTGIDIRHYKDRAVAEKERADQAERLAEAGRREAIAAERARMARELHDVIANHLSAIAIHATGADAIGGASLPSKVRDALRVIRENSVQGLAEMRQMIELLREPGDDPAARPRLEEVDRLVGHARQAGLDVTMTQTGAADAPLPVAVDLAAYRIVQESLTNALKHAAGGRVEVVIEHRPGGLAVTVDSVGTSGERPAPVVPGSGVGLIGMRERVTLLGGAFTAGPYDGGFRVRAELPA